MIYGTCIHMKYLCMTIHYLHWWQLLLCWIRAHFINEFSIVIQIWWETHSVLIQFVFKWSLYNFTHGMTAVLPSYAEFGSDIIPYDGVTLNPISHKIWIMMEESFVKWAPGGIVSCSSLMSPWLSNLQGTLTIADATQNQQSYAGCTAIHGDQQNWIK